MTTMAIAAGVFSVAAWWYLLLGRGGFWREMHKCSTWNNCAKPAGRHISQENFAGAVQEWERVVAVIPARNEAATIGRAVTSLLTQQFGGTLRVIVVDDQSSDGTAEVARAAAKAHICQNQADVGHPRLTVISGRPLPPGWSGKVWAMQQGIEAARAFNPNFFLLTDADVVHAPDSLATLLTIAKSGDYDLTSFMVRLYCASLAERLLIPAFVFFFFMLYPPRWVADSGRSTAGAAGGCMLLRAEALERAGGMAAIRGEVIDDCALARAIKTPAQAKPGLGRGTREQRKGRVWLGLSDDTASVRPYDSFRGIGHMIARSAFNQLRHSTLLLAGALFGMVMAFVVPVVLVLLYPTLAKTGPGWATPVVLGGVAWSLMTLAYLPMVRFCRLNPLWSATLPAAACFYMGATLWSAVKYWSGRGGEWKGRVQDVRK